MKRIILILIIFIFGLNSLSLAKNDNIKKVKEYLKNSNTYYWLSRARDNVLTDIDKTLEYAKKAQKLLENEKQTTEITSLLDEAKVAILDAENQKEVNSDVIWSFSQVIPLLLKDDTIYEFYDDIDEVALERSIKQNFEAIDKKVSYKHQLYLIIISDKKDHFLEELAHTYLNENSIHHALSKHEVMSVLNKSEFDSLYENKINYNLLRRLSDSFSDQGIGILKLALNDKVDAITYYGTNYSFWNSKSNTEIHKFYADGFCEKPLNDLFAYLLIISGLLRIFEI